MSAASAPSIPPRPARTHQQIILADSMETPKIPPRPANRRPDRSPSPHRNKFAPSPLNESSSTTTNRREKDISSDNLPSRPASVSLPSVGQEGNEYANFSYDTHIDTGKGLEASQVEPRQTRNVATDLKLHAPKPSLPTSSATARVAPVTRTDSSQAAAAGIGRASSQADHKDPHTRSLKPQISFTRPDSSASTERPDSAMPGDNEQGIPEIGQQVPMYPNAGDVQAPSPSPFSQGHSSGIGFFSDGLQKPGRNHLKTRSGREAFQGPPGSYGLHGHGILSQDRFEKAWYEKHPEVLEREEHGEYGPGIGGGRGEWALSSEDLNKIVRNTASRGAGFGTSRDVTGTPNEQIGYIASEEYASRMTSRPQSVNFHSKAHSNSSQTHVESPLRKASFPVDITGKEEFDRSKNLEPKHHHHENALESEAEEEDVIHVDPPSRRSNKYGGNGYDPPTEDLGPQGGNTSEEGGWLDERGYGVPILASDEVAKEEGAEFLQPAVSPKQERKGNNYFAGVDSDHPPSYQSGSHQGGVHPGGSRGSSVAGSRPTSRPVSLHGTSTNLSRFTSHDEREEQGTPLEDVNEYEPLFPEEGTEDKHLSTVGKLKRPERRRFPSQDIWEDTPEYAQLQATVSTPQIPEEEVTSKNAYPARVLESPEAEAARKDEVSEQDRASFLPAESQHPAKTHFKPHLRDDIPTRPGMKQRFPSRDIWEDTPDSLRLETTVDTPQIEDFRSPPDTQSIMDAGTGAQEQVLQKTFNDDKGRPASGVAAAIEKPTIPARPTHDKIADGAARNSLHTSQPSIPARPAQRMRQVPPVELPPVTSQPPAGNQNQPRTVPPVWVPPTKADEGRIEPYPTPVERKAPDLPERPKPQVPARPAKPAAPDSAEQVPLTKTVSVASASSTASADDKSLASKGITSPPIQKAKPSVPARPNGGKIASLKAGFLSDLDKRLQLGPQAPKVQEKIEQTVREEEEQQKSPLVDARKGRARGPARRKPNASPSGAADGTSREDTGKLEIAKPSTVWHIAESGDVVVGSDIMTPLTSSAITSKSVDQVAVGAAADNTGVVLQFSKTPIKIESSSLSEEASHQQGTRTTQADKTQLVVGNASMIDGQSSVPAGATSTFPASEDQRDLQPSTAEETVDAHSAASSIPTHAPANTSMTATAAPMSGHSISTDSGLPEASMSLVEAGTSVDSNLPEDNTAMSQE